MNVKIPPKFESKEDYLSTLSNLLDNESQLERLNIEMYAEKDISFQFIERLEVYCKLSMRIPRTTNQQQIRENVMLCLLIPRQVEHGNIILEPYVGVG